MAKYPLTMDMIRSRVQPRPTELWKWGISNRSGKLQTMPQDLLWASLLPVEKALVTEKGIRFAKLNYSSERAMTEGWFVRARTNKSWPIKIAYDPRFVDEIYYRECNESRFEICRLTEASAASFKGCSFEEVADFHKRQKEGAEISLGGERQATVSLDSQIESVVNSGKKRTEAVRASTNESNAARFKDLRRNRNDEKEQERRANRPTTSNGVKTHSAGVVEVDHRYIAPPSEMDFLRPIQQKHLKP